MNSRYHTSTPVNATIGVVVVIVVTSLIFLVYDYLLQNRVEFLSSMAGKTSKLLNSLFPKFALARMLSTNDNDTDEGDEHSARSPSVRETVGKLKNFMMPRYPGRYYCIRYFV